MKAKSFTFFLMLCFVFLASCALALNSSTKATNLSTDSPLAPLVAIFNNKHYPLAPKLSPQAVPPPVVSAQAALALDLSSSTPLYEKNPDQQFLPASTTKILTALVAMELYGDDEILTVDGLRVPGQEMGLLKGEQISVKNLLDGLLIFSANDAAWVLAQNYPGGRPAFVEAMNKKAASLNLTNSHFDNPVGFDSQGNYATARDLVRVGEIAMLNPRFARIVGIKQKTVTSLDGKVVHNLVSTNKLLGEVPGVLGVKTGWTQNARENLVTYLERDGHKMVIALMGSSDRFGETKEIINWITANYDWQEIKAP